LSFQSLLVNRSRATTTLSHLISLPVNRIDASCNIQIDGVITMNITKRFPAWKASVASLLLLATIGCGTPQQAAPASTQTDKKEESKVAQGIELGKNGPITIDFWHIQATIYGDAIKEMVQLLIKNMKVKLLSKKCSKVRMTI
jgi:hypothetical protein